MKGFIEKYQDKILGCSTYVLLCIVLFSIIGISYLGSNYIYHDNAVKKANIEKEKNDISYLILNSKKNFYLISFSNIVYNFENYLIDKDSDFIKLYPLTYLLITDEKIESNVLKVNNGKIIFNAEVIIKLSKAEMIDLYYNNYKKIKNIEYKLND